MSSRPPSWKRWRPAPGPSILSYLETGPRSVGAVRELVARGGLDVTYAAAVVHQFRALLVAHGEIEMLNLGLPNGDFLMVKRMSDDSFSTKRVVRRGEVAESLWDHDNPDWSEQPEYADRREPVAEAYDPRSRPWYRTAVDNGGPS